MQAFIHLQVFINLSNHIPLAGIECDHTWRVCENPRLRLCLVFSALFSESLLYFILIFHLIEPSYIIVR